MISYQKTEIVKILVTGHITGALIVITQLILLALQESVAASYVIYYVATRFTDWCFDFYSLFSVWKVS